MKDNRSQQLFFIIAGTIMTLAAGISQPLLPNVLRALIKRNWLYSVDTAPLDLRLPVVAAVSIALAAAVVLWLVRPGPEPLSGKKPLLAILLLILFLIPLKNGSFTHAMFFALALPASVLVWKAARPWEDRSASLLARAGRAAMTVPALAWQLGLFAAGTGIYILSSYILSDFTPRCIDEVDYLFQAKIFARGMAWAPLPPAPDFFHHVNLAAAGGKWLSHYPPGWPALLSAGVIAGAPALVNPVLGGLMLVLIYQLAREVRDEPAARCASLLALFSPYLMAMNSSMMSHTSCALMVLGFLLMFEQGLARRSPGRMFLATLCLGAAAAIRPYTAFLIALPSAAAMLAELVRSPGRTWKLAAAALAGPAAPIIALLAYNRLTTGSALTFGYQSLYGDSIALGFGPRQFPYPHTLIEGLRLAHSRLLAISHNLVPGPVPLLAIAGLGFLAAKSNRKTIRLALTFLSLPAGYVFFFFQDFVYEPRFLFESSAALIILAAIGLQTVLARFNSSAPLKHYLAAAIASGLLIHVSLGLAALGKGGDLGPELKHQVQARDLKGSLIVIDPLWYPEGMARQSPFLDGDNIYVRDLGERNPEIIAAFPGRPAYRFSFDRAAGVFKLEPMAPRVPAIPFPPDPAIINGKEP